MWHGGQASLISSGTGEASLFVGATPSGDDAYITSPNRLVQQASLISGLLAIYDARVGGGFRSKAPAGSCEQGGSCEGPPATPPSPPLIGSIVFDGDAGPPSTPSKASVEVKRRKAVSGTVGRLQVRVPGAGKISVDGHSIRSTRKSVTKAGSYPVTIRLKRSAGKQLPKKGKLTVSARVSYRAKDGRSAAKTVKVTFKQPKAKSGKGKKGGR
jgi:hypothetical protein